MKKRTYNDFNEDDKVIHVLCIVILVLLVMASVVMTCTSCSSTKKVTKEHNKEIIVSDSSVYVSVKDTSSYNVTSSISTHDLYSISSIIKDDSSTIHLVVVDYDTLGRKVRESILDMKNGSRSVIIDSSSEKDTNEILAIGVVQSKDSIFNTDVSSCSYKESKNKYVEKTYPIGLIRVMFASFVFIVIYILFMFIKKRFFR